MNDPISVKGLAAADKALSEGAGLLARVLGPAADEVGAVLAEKVRGFFGRNVRAVAQRAEDMLAAAGKEPQEIAMRDAVPLLEGARAEDDPAMQERWAALLANASLSEGSQPVALF